MGQHRHYWLHEISKSFGMDTTRFAKCMGYSRQSIYQAACGTTQLKSERLDAAISKLEVMNERQFEADKRTAVKNYEYRKKLIADLVERLTG